MESRSTPGKPEYPRENLSGRREKKKPGKLNPRIVSSLGSGIEPGPLIGGRRILTPMYQIGFQVGLFPFNCISTLTTTNQKVISPSRALATEVNSLLRSLLSLSLTVVSVWLVFESALWANSVDDNETVVKQN